MRTTCILHTQRPGYKPKKTCHLSSSTAKQQSPHENNKIAFNLVLHCPYEQPTQTYAGACTHVQVASAILGYITKTVVTKLAKNIIITFLLLNGCLLLCPHRVRLRHMRPRSIGLIPSVPANTKLSKVEQNTHMAIQLRCRACPNIADNPPLPQPCKEVLHPCTIEAMDIVVLLLVFTQSFPTNTRYKGTAVCKRPLQALSCAPISKSKNCLCVREGQKKMLIPNHNIYRGSRH